MKKRFWAGWPTFAVLAKKETHAARVQWGGPSKRSLLGWGFWSVKAGQAFGSSSPTLLGRARLQSCRQLADSIQAPQGTNHVSPKLLSRLMPMITTTSDEMQLIGAVIAPGMVGHEASLLVRAKKSCDRRPRRRHFYQKTR